MVYIFLADGFEEIEALATCDMLRRADIPCQLVTVDDSLDVRGAHKILVKADVKIDEADLLGAEALILPGGMPGADNLWHCQKLKEALKLKADRGDLICAICAAPFIFGRLGLLQGKNATIYSGMEDELKGATIRGNKVEVADNIITANGPGTAVDFAAAIIEKLKGKEVADGILRDMLVIK